MNEVGELGNWKVLLNPFALVVAELDGHCSVGTIARALRGMLRSRSDDEIRAIAAACDSPTETNCWWATYSAARILRKEVPWILRERQHDGGAAREARGGSGLDSKEGDPSWSHPRSR
ncbi:MAG TPA: hypothetical protein GX506_00330 [Firmicutes bacterium]|nr:hypothetical protein [Bacillota bacterium]